ISEEELCRPCERCHVLTLCHQVRPLAASRVLLGHNCRDPAALVARPPAARVKYRHFDHSDSIHVPIPIPVDPPLIQRTPVTLELRYHRLVLPQDAFGVQSCVIPALGESLAQVTQ